MKYFYLITLILMSVSSSLIASDYAISVEEFDEIKLKVNIRLISIGRLDFNSEGLLLLTNNGDFARKLELPQNKFQRTYKVRIFGIINNGSVVIDG